jgi:outer membrane protein OmpA-like peptidoglycan-associated protein
VLSLPFAANAQPVTGLYVGAGVGANYTQQQQVKNLQGPNVTGLGDGLSLSGDLKGAWGFVGLASIGYGFGNGLRAEVEGNYRQATIGGFTNFNTGNLAGGATEKKYGGFVNVLYDFVDVVPYVQPYIGAGVGALWVNYNNLHAYNGTQINFPGTGDFIPAGGLGVHTNSTKTSFAYQAIVGAAFPLDMVTPGLALTAEYRFLGTTGNNSYNATIVANGVNGGVGVGTATASKIQLGPNFNQAILVGLRYNFGVAPAPAPAPVVAPAPAPARSYLVFFDWDKYNLTDRARQIIHEAAENSTHVQYTRIEVNGYTDTSGTPKYNMGLSIRRANAVAAELVKDGVPKSSISIQGFGDTHLLVPTGPGVREPQNRRVEIIIR